MKKLPTFERVNELLRYDSSTGKLYWKTARKRSDLAGQEAGGWRSNRRLITIDYQQYYVSRIVWLLYYGEEPKAIIDHIDRNPSNDRIWNLRDVSQKQNCENRSRKPIVGITSLAFIL